MNTAPLSFMRTMKPCMPTYYPTEVRQQSVGKENRAPIKHSSCSQIRFMNNVQKNQDSFETQKPQEINIDKVRIQMVQFQYEQSALNEQFQIQIKSLNDRIINNEQSLKQIYDTGIGQMNYDIQIKEKIKQIELKMGEIQLQIINEQQKSQIQTQTQLEQLKKNIIETQNQMEIKINTKLDILNQKIQKPLEQNYLSQDIKRFEQFNQEVSSYLNSSIKSQDVQQISPKSINNAYKCQMSAISEKTVEESRCDYQYELDSNGYLISNGTYILDQDGQRYQLSQEQIKYLQSINVIEEIST